MHKFPNTPTLETPADGIRIRLGNGSDIEAVTDLVRRVIPGMCAAGNRQWDDTYPNRGVFERDVAENQMWVADLEGQIAAVAAITTDQQPEYADAGLDTRETAIVVHRLAVDPEFRGRGMARALLLQAEEVARKRGIQVLRIDTAVQNTVTQSLFPKLGYVLAGEVGLSFRPGLRVICYEKRLPAATRSEERRWDRLALRAWQEDSRR